MNDAVNLLQQEELTIQWQQTLFSVANSKSSSPVIAGYSTRLLADHRLINDDELVRTFYFAMSSSAAPAQAAAWLEGFLKGSGTLLLMDDALWNIINGWLKELDEETFTQVLPLLRRTFSNFSAAERRKLGEKAKAGGIIIVKKSETGFDDERAKKGIPVMMELFGYKMN